MPKTIKLLFVAVAWTLLIAYLSLVTIRNIGTVIPFSGTDKLVHFFFYFIFVFVWSYYLKAKKSIVEKKYSILLIAILYGCFMEVCQEFFTTNRVADIYDVLANSLGAVSAFLIRKKLK